MVARFGVLVQEVSEPFAAMGRDKQPDSAQGTESASRYSSGWARIKSDAQEL